ncbi:MAG: DUF4114 domain-containing protein [Candidatus Paceibacterota bacterium]
MTPRKETYMFLAAVLALAVVASLAGVHFQAFEGQIAAIKAGFADSPVPVKALVVPYTDDVKTASKDEIRAFLSGNDQSVTSHFADKGRQYEFEVLDWITTDLSSDDCSQETLFAEAGGLFLETDEYDVVIFMLAPREICQWNALSFPKHNMVFMQLESGAAFNWSVVASALGPIEPQKNGVAEIKRQFRVYANDPVVVDAPRGERNLTDILTSHGYDLDVDNDSTGQQTWEACEGETVLSARVLAIQAANRNKFAYIYNDDEPETLLNPPANWNGIRNSDREVATTHSIATNSGDTLAFAVDSGLRIFSSATSSNSDGRDHAVTYQVATSTYLIGFEDSKNYADDDFNDLVMQVSITCGEGVETSDE